LAGFFSSAVALNDDAIGCNPAPIAYLDQDPAILDAQNPFSEAMAEIKSMPGSPRRLAFTTAIRGLCNFVSQVPQAFVGRALICGLACHNHDMLLCRPSLRRFMGPSRRTVNDHLVHSRVLESRTESSRVPPWSI
jgi:hypothetical protein